MQILEWLEAHLASRSLSPAQTEMAVTVVLLIGVATLGIVANAVVKHVFLKLLTKATERMGVWQDVLKRRRVFARLANLAPGLVIYHLAQTTFPYWPVVGGAVKRVALLVLVVLSARLINAVLSALSDVYETLALAKTRPIRAFVQVLKIAVYVVAGTLVVSLIIDRSPVVLLSGFGALSAIAMLVFKDSILGLVASVQFSALDLVRKGDWIEVPQFDANGDVIDISLTAVQVQNWDKTITVVPTYALVSGSFKNWRGMTESGGRRIMRAIHLDQQTVRFCSAAELDRFESIVLIRDYVRRKREEIARDNAEHDGHDLHEVNGRRLTNLGTFRAYVTAYLRQHPGIHQEMVQLVRQLAPTEHGVAIQVYCFTNDTAWVNYETIQADIFDHLLAIIPFFGLKVFQAPSGADVHRLVEGGLSLALPIPEDPTLTPSDPIRPR